MNRFCRGRKRVRKGLTLSELVVACAIAVTALMAVVQLTFLASRQYRVIADRNVIAQEAANIMEDLMSRPWSEVAASKPPAVSLSPACREVAPDAQLELLIGPDEQLNAARRISVTIAWQARADQPLTSVHLVAWRYGPEANDVKQNEIESPAAERDATVSVESAHESPGVPTSKGLVNSI